MLDRMKGALTRKIGPLPAWAWALIGGVGLYLYRQRTQPQTDPAAYTSDVPPTEPRDTVPLGPGDSVYDPNTGKLIGTAPEQQPVDTVRPDPIVLDPGQKVYDPVTGQLIGGDSSKAAAEKKKKKPSAKLRAQALRAAARHGIRRGTLAKFAKEHGRLPTQKEYDRLKQKHPAKDKRTNKKPTHDNRNKSKTPPGKSKPRSSQHHDKTPPPPAHAAPRSTAAVKNTPVNRNRGAHPPKPKVKHR